ncbi:tyrosine-type recombinase/integrase [Falsihalocynthiibacter sp. CO-5D18]|uniref:tyrosine-type recombinase/integrase n=1 Tax=Falsihalocynthiibacter sp. CO-5D18 TaxID=3240872 RepID=UPI00350F36B6
MTKRQKYLYRDKDRHGNSRWYFSPPLSTKTRLKHAEGTSEFRKEYLWLFNQWEKGEIAPSQKVTVNSIEWLIRKYQASGTFKALAHNTQIQRSNFYTRFCRAYGEVSASSLTAKDIADVRDTFGSRRFAARNFVKAMRAVFAWAVEAENDYLLDNPAAKVKIPSGATQGHAVWSLEDVKRMKDFYPQGHNARICLAILLFTGQRISDVRVMGRTNVKGTFLNCRQVKTGNEIEIPISPVLRTELGVKFNDLIWLQTANGAPYSEKSCSMRFSHWAKEAGLEDRTAHGLRKSVGTILAELGLSEDVIMSVLGHTSAEQVRTYIKTNKRRDLAEKGMIEFEKEVAKIW